MEEPPHLGRPVRVIGRYALYGKLAAGGMATVHFGRLLGPAGFSRTVAIKRLHPQFAKDPEFVAMFLDEARLAARIQHPNVVATVDVVAMSEELFLVMDYIRGESFSRLLRASRRKGIEIPLGVVVNVMVGVLHGLHAAHEAKDEQGRPLSVVHRDVSPQNVLVGVDGVPRLLDFGVAKAAARIQVTRDGQMKGKLSYMAPEQLQGRSVDRRADVFAAAIVAWEALTGRRLFDAEEPQEVLRMVVSEDIPPPSAVVPSIPRAIDDAVMRGLARDLSVRYQTARQFAIALEEATQLASPREVGEWVERAAGDTLLHREQAVAEIEAISTVSDVSVLSGAPPVASTMVAQAPAPPATVSDWDENPTRVYDSATAVSAGDDPRTRVHGRGSSPPEPLPRRTPPSIPSLVPPAARAPVRPRPSTSRPPGAEPSTRSQVPPRPRSAPIPIPIPIPRGSVPPLRSSAPPKPRRSAPPTRSHAPEQPHPQLSPLPPFDDSDQTLIRPGLAAAEDPDQTPVLSKDKQGWDDDGEATHVMDRRSADELLDAAARVTGPPQRSRRPVVPAPRPAAGSPPAVTTIIVQDHTTPALRRQRPAPWIIGLAWLSEGRTARARRVGLVAGVVGLLVGFTLYGVSATHGTTPRAAPLGTVQPDRPPVVAMTVAEPHPGRVDPPTVPRPAPDDDEPQRALAPSEPSPPVSEVGGGVKAAFVVLRAPAHPRSTASLDRHLPSTPVSVRATPSTSSTSLGSGAENDDLESPYAAKPAAPAGPASKPASLDSSSGKVSASKVSACAQPFTVDDNGIRRVRPECL